MRKLAAIVVLVLAGCGGGGGGDAPPTVATPVFSPAAGTYATVQSVTITCATAGAAIHYTADGSTPTASSPTWAAAVPVTVTGTTLKAMATAAGKTDSAVASATYTLKVATPVISPAAGTYGAVQSVTITSATAGAAIHYTTDGSTPTAASPTYDGAIAVTATATTVKALATATGFDDSAVASATYTLQAATPVISPAAGTYATAQSVTITSATPGAVVHYTLDGSAPTPASTTYTAAIPLPAGGVATTTTVKAIAVVAGFADSAAASSTFVIDPAATQAAAPTFAPVAGTYTSVQNVVISSTSAGATVYYTADGTTPTTASTAYAAPVQVDASKTLKAIAAGGAFTASTVASAAYVINLPPAATPAFAPPAGTYASAQSVTISSATPGATIHYTADGSTPTTASTVYSAPVLVNASKTLKAIATATGFSTSAVGSAAYVIQAPAATPTFNPGAGTYPSAQSVVIASTTPGATIHYTADGSTPTTASTVYSAPVQVATSLTLKAIATATGFSSSAVGSASYVIGGGGTPFVTLCNGLFAKMTSLFETCLQANPAFVPSLIGATSDFCADRQREIDAGKISYDPVAGAACASAVQALDCGAISGESGLSVPATCNASLVGQVATGGQCFDSADCANGYCGWDLAAGSCPDTCRPFVQLNQPCAGPDCAPGLECDGTTGSFICSAPAALGGPCPCQEGLWCDRTVLPNTCRGFLPAGASCIPNGDPCTILTTCAGTPATCKPWLAAGATCVPADFQCGLGYECSATGNTCISWPTLGQACEGFCLGSWCDLTAVTPTCQAQKADGATCIPFLNGADCLSGSCNSTTSRCEASRCFIP